MLVHRSSSAAAPVPSSLVPILYLQMITIVMFVAHEVFWDTTSKIAPKPILNAFLPQQQEEQPILLFGRNPPTPAPRIDDSSSRWFHHPKFHYTNITTTRKLYHDEDFVSPCPELHTSKRKRPQIPTFVLGGTQKAGTSALYYLLKDHPDIVSSLRFETHFFDNAVRKQTQITGDSASNETICQLYQEYREEFPKYISKNAITFEKVPAYLCRSRIPSFMKRVAPWVKIVFILRNPIDRAHSAWKMEYNTPSKQLPGFREFVDSEVLQLRSLQLSLAPTWSEIVARNYTSQSFKGRPPVWHRTGLGNHLPAKRQAKIRNLQCGHLSRGFYAQQLIPWLEAFGRENILILRFEDFEANQMQVLQQILDFVGATTPLQVEEDALNHEYRPRNQVLRRDGKVGGDMREYLKRFYKPYNDELADLLGDEWKNVWD